MQVEGPQVPSLDKPSDSMPEAGVVSKGRENGARSHSAKPAAEARLVWDPIDLRAVLNGGRITPAPTVLARSDGVHLFYPGRVNMVMGEPESGKTWVADYAAAQELKAGHHVVFFDFEDVAETSVERLLALGAKPEEILARFSYYDTPPRFDELGRDVLQGYFAERGAPSLFVLDGVTEAMGMLGLDPYKGLDVTQFYGAAPRWFAKLGAAAVLLDHVVKDKEGRGRWAIGSERKLSGLDGAAYSVDLLRPFGRERTGQAKLTLAKDRCGHVRQHEGAGRAIAILELEAWPDGKISARLEAPEPSSDRDRPFRPTVIMERVSKTLEGAPAPLSARAVRGQTTGKVETVAIALELLVAEGYVAAEAAGRGAVMHRSLRPFRADVQEGER